jgi:RimJ/RimL family protein N-acetyltransferase
MFLKVASSLVDVMRVRGLRNSCRSYLTNYKGHIGPIQQMIWHFSKYQPARKSGQYRLYLLRDNQGAAVAYGALALEDDKLLVTECVGEKHRRKGYGSAVLAELIDVALSERRDLLADIWATNQASIAMHERSGFQLISVSHRNGEEVRRYLLPATSPQADGIVSDGSRKDA